MPATKTNVELDQLAVNTIKFLAVDGVEKAKSGHPGLPMGAADYAYVLWTKYLRYNPKDPEWPNRDRFVLSGGHGSMLLYSLLHLAGFDMPLEELQQFRQWCSATPGHPEHELERGIETTTGPLGQGISNAVGMAMASKRLAALFNRPGYDVIDHYIYVIASDGDLMEGISHESCSLAGHLGLGNLIVLYDDNHISIEGDTCSRLLRRRREAVRGLRLARAEDRRPRPRRRRRGARQREGRDRPAQHHHRAHPHRQRRADTSTTPPARTASRWARRRSRPRRSSRAGRWTSRSTCPRRSATSSPRARPSCRADYDAWQAMFAKYCEEFPELDELWNRMMAKEVPDGPGRQADLATLDCAKPTATRDSSGQVIQELAKLVPALWGGSADLSPSNKTDVKGGGDFSKDDPLGRNIHFGVREHGMGSAMNGMALYGGVIPYGGTFLIFSDYMRPTIRLASLMKLQVIYVFTHDSIFVGEDGPTHEPIEQLASLRAIPGVTVIRPADTAETAVAWAVALENKTGPTALALTRQNLDPVQRRPREGQGPAQGRLRGSGRRARST